MRRARRRCPCTHHAYGNKFLSLRRRSEQPWRRKGRCAAPTIPPTTASRGQGSEGLRPSRAPAVVPPVARPRAACLLRGRGPAFVQRTSGVAGRFSPAGQPTACVPARTCVGALPEAAALAARRSSRPPRSSSGPVFAQIGRLETGKGAILVKKLSYPLVFVGLEDSRHNLWQFARPRGQAEPGPTLLPRGTWHPPQQRGGDCCSCCSCCSCRARMAFCCVRVGSSPHVYRGAPRGRPGPGVLRPRLRPRAAMAGRAAGWWCSSARGTSVW